MRPNTTVTRDVSWYRTEHRFDHLIDATSPEAIRAAYQLSQNLKVPFHFIGNGSNCLIMRKRVRSVIVRNRLPKTLDWPESNKAVASSALPIMAILKGCRTRRLESFYYLASVPATVGGAVFMNAGRGREHNKTILDFVESVECMDLRSGETKVLQIAEIGREYRWTTLHKHPELAVLNATFCFPESDAKSDSIKERVSYSLDQQDHSQANCGSVFKEFDNHIMKALKGFSIAKSSYSKKTLNWILNSGRNPWPIVTLVRIALLAHALLRRRATLELTKIE